jgi:hypothetical protein
VPFQGQGDEAKQQGSRDEQAGADQTGPTVTGLDVGPLPASGAGAVRSAAPVSAPWLVGNTRLDTDVVVPLQPTPLAHRLEGILGPVVALYGLEDTTQLLTGGT